MCSIFPIILGPLKCFDLNALFYEVFGEFTNPLVAVVSSLIE